MLAFPLKSNHLHLLIHEETKSLDERTFWKAPDHYRAYCTQMQLYLCADAVCLWVCSSEINTCVWVLLIQVPWGSKLPSTAATSPPKPVDKPTVLMGCWDSYGDISQSGQRSECGKGQPCLEGKEQPLSRRQMRMLHWYWQDDGLKQGHFEIHQNIQK